MNAMMSRHNTWVIPKVITASTVFLLAAPPNDTIVPPILNATIMQYGRITPQMALVVKGKHIDTTIITTIHGSHEAVTMDIIASEASDLLVASLLTEDISESDD